MNYQIVDFGLMNEIQQIKASDYLEGDFKYMSKELLYVDDDNFNSVKLKKCDVFALGMTLLDILLGRFRRGKFTKKRKGMGKGKS